MFHRHTWKIVEEREQPSGIEVMRESGVTNFKSGGWDTWESMTRRDVIVKRVCETCGEEEVKRV